MQWTDWRLFFSCLFPHCSPIVRTVLREGPSCATGSMAWKSSSRRSKPDGFAKAADRLSLSRSAVGKAIARLEERLGVRLFHRTTRTAKPDGGWPAILRAMRAGHRGTAGGRVSSGIRPTRCLRPIARIAARLFGRYCAAPILLAYARQHPRLELELSFNDRQIDLIADGFDLAIRNGVLGNGTALPPADWSASARCSAPLQPILPHAGSRVLWRI